MTQMPPTLPWVSQGRPSHSHVHGELTTFRTIVLEKEGTADDSPGPGTRVPLRAVGDHWTMPRAPKKSDLLENHQFPTLRIWRRGSYNTSCRLDYIPIVLKTQIDSALFWLGEPWCCSDNVCLFLNCCDPLITMPLCAQEPCISPASLCRPCQVIDGLAVDDIGLSRVISSVNTGKDGLNSWLTKMVFVAVVEKWEAKFRNGDFLTLKCFTCTILETPKMYFFKFAWVPYSRNFGCTKSWLKFVRTNAVMMRAWDGLIKLPRFLNETETPYNMAKDNLLPQAEATAKKHINQVAALLPQITFLAKTHSKLDSRLNQVAQFLGRIMRNCRHGTTSCATPHPAWIEDQWTVTSPGASHPSCWNTWEVATCISCGKVIELLVIGSHQHC